MVQQQLYLGNRGFCAAAKLSENGILSELSQNLSSLFHGRDRTVPPNLFVLGELIEELPAYVFGKRIPRTGGTAAH